MRLLILLLLSALLCSCSSDAELDRKINRHILISTKGECFYLRHNIGDNYFVNQIDCEEINNIFKNKENK